MYYNTAVEDSEAHIILTYEAILTVLQFEIAPLR